MILPALQKIQQTQIQQQEKTKAKNLDFLKSIQNTLGWESADGEELNKIRKNIDSEYLRLTVEGKDPFSDKNFRDMFTVGKSAIEKTKEDEKLYNDAISKAYQNSFLKGADTETIATHLENVDKWKSQGIQRGALPTPPTLKDKDYTKEILGITSAM